MSRHPEPKLILASRSPQRARLLREAGLAFVQADPPFADPPQPGDQNVVQDARRVAMDLAGRKAASLRDAGVFVQYPEGLILAADTICVGREGRLIGQPADRDEARAMITSFLGRAHEVVSGVALLCANDDQSALFADVAIVSMHAISAEELDAYVNSDQWRGKAGGYNLFDRQRAGWPITVSGDPTTVVGLPMRQLLDVLKRRGIVSHTKGAATAPHTG